MKPIGPLMIEHRLIERMVELMSRELNRMNSGEQPDVNFIGQAADFMRTYGDRCHHGKEENILFIALADKSLSPEHQQTMAELVREHNEAREMLGELTDARSRYAAGAGEAVSTIAKCLEGLVRLYPHHIATEDKHFFIPIMEYFTETEQQNMLQEFAEFDRALIHGKYEQLVTELEQNNTE